MIQDLGYSFTVSDEELRHRNFDVVAFLKEDAERRVGEEVLKMLRGGQRLTVRFVWGESPTFGYHGRGMQYTLRAELAAVQTRQVVMYERPEIDLRVPHYEPRRKPMLNRIGGFFAEVWESAKHPERPTPYLESLS